MTQNDLFEKYADYIPAGWYGFDSIPDECVAEIDALLQEMIKVPGFEIHQIKQKFGGLRFYVNCSDDELNNKARDLENKFSSDEFINRRKLIIAARQAGKTELQTDLFKSLLNKE